MTGPFLPETGLIYGSTFGYASGIIALIMISGMIIFVLFVCVWNCFEEQYCCNQIKSSCCQKENSNDNIIRIHQKAEGIPIDVLDENVNN